MKFRKKPLVIDAVKFESVAASRKALDELEGRSSCTMVICAADEPPFIVVNTLEGNLRADLGDYIIRGVKGELYPYRADIFEATYEAVE